MFHGSPLFSLEGSCARSARQKPVLRTPSFYTIRDRDQTASEESRQKNRGRLRGPNGGSIDSRSLTERTLCGRLGGPGGHCPASCGQTPGKAGIGGPSKSVVAIRIKPLRPEADGATF